MQSLNRINKQHIEHNRNESNDEFNILGTYFRFTFASVVASFVAFQATHLVYVLHRLIVHI
jgi:hypothetical protein